jgi:hypothetical protein
VGYTTVVPGTAITASWANANVRDQVVTPFATALARDSAITAPVEGMICYLADVDQFWYYNGSLWAPIPSTLVGRSNKGSSSATTTGEVLVTYFSAAAKQAQPIAVQTGPLRLNSNTSGDFVMARIRYTIDGSNPTTSSAILSTVEVPTGSAQSAITFTELYIPATTHTVKFGLTVGRFAGSGTVGLVVDSNQPNINVWATALGSDPGDGGTDP